MKICIGLLGFSVTIWVFWITRERFNLIRVRIKSELI